MYTLPNVKWIATGEAAALHREISLVLSDHLYRWDREGGREMQEGGHIGIYVYI